MDPTRQVRRLWLIGAAMVTVVACLAARLHHVMLRRQADLGAKAQALAALRETLPPWRGDVVARDGTVLATTIPVRTVYVDLALSDKRLPQVIEVASRRLDLPPREVRSRIQEGLLEALRRDPDHPKGAVVLKRNVRVTDWHVLTNALEQESFGFAAANGTRAERQQLRQLRRDLLFSAQGQQRVHPFGNLACHVLGYTTLETGGPTARGAAGVEASMDQVLAGAPGFRLSSKDAAGRELPHRRRALQAPRDGGRVMLTLDVAIQRLAEEALLEVVSSSQPEHASILVVRPSTGEILAWAGWPTFAPDDPGASPPGNWVNWPLWAPFEPGSTFKTFTLAAALEDGLTTLEAQVYCGRGRLQWNHMVFTDRGLSFGWVPVIEGFFRSLNTAHVQLAIGLGRERFLHHATNFGFAETTGIALPFERSGSIQSLKDPAQAAHAYASFGQGISVTQLQLTMAFCAVVNGGVLMKPMLVGRLRDAAGRRTWDARPTPARRVLSPVTSERMRQALQEAVEAPEATGRAAALPGFRSGGKTGTAEKAGERHRGYLPGRYVASFVGAVPIQNPELVISIVIDEPRGAHGGGAIAAPVFAKVAAPAARWLGLPEEPRSLLTSTRR